MIYEKQPIGALLVFSLFSLLPAQTFAQSKQNSQSKSLVFTHVTIIDATGAPARPDLTVVVSGERIIGLGKTREESVTFLSYCFLIGCWVTRFRVKTPPFACFRLLNFWIMNPDGFALRACIGNFDGQISQDAAILRLGDKRRTIPKEKHLSLCYFRA